MICVSYDYTAEVTNRFKGLDPTDRVQNNYGWSFDSVQKAGIKTIPKKEMQKSKMAD